MLGSHIYLQPRMARAEASSGAIPLHAWLLCASQQGQLTLPSQQATRPTSVSLFLLRCPVCAGGQTNWAEVERCEEEYMQVGLTSAARLTA